METLLVNTSDTLQRMQAFLGLGERASWGHSKMLPHANSARVNATLDCWTAGQLEAIYNQANAGLEDLINSRNRPPQEPPFVPFESALSSCDSSASAVGGGSAVEEKSCYEVTHSSFCKS